LASCNKVVKRRTWEHTSAMSKRLGGRNQQGKKLSKRERLNAAVRRHHREKEGIIRTDDVQGLERNELQGKNQERMCDHAPPGAGG